MASAKTREQDLVYSFSKTLQECPMHILEKSQQGKRTMQEATLSWLEQNDYKKDDLNFQGSYGNSALMKAAREGNAQLVSDLLQAGVEIHLKNVDGNMALWLACFGENPEVVKLLIDAGIEIDTCNVNGVTPLMYAASSGKEKMVAMLLEAGADVNIRNPDDFSALDLASTSKIYKMLRACSQERV